MCFFHFVAAGAITCAGSVEIENTGEQVVSARPSDRLYRATRLGPWLGPIVGKRPREACGFCKSEHAMCTSKRYIGCTGYVLLQHFPMMARLAY